MNRAGHRLVWRDFTREGGHGPERVVPPEVVGHLRMLHDAVSDGEHAVNGEMLETAEGRTGVR